MLPPTLPAPDRQRLLALLLDPRAGLARPLAHETFLDEAGLHEAASADLLPAATTADFARELLRWVARHEGAATGQPALLGVLRALRDRLAGHEAEAAYLAGLIARYEGPAA